MVRKIYAKLYMIQLNPQYEAIFDARNIDEDCNKIADEINDVARMQIKEIYPRLACISKPLR